MNIKLDKTSDLSFKRIMKDEHGIIINEKTTPTGLIHQFDNAGLDLNNCTPFWSVLEKSNGTNNFSNLPEFIPNDTNRPEPEPVPPGPVSPIYQIGYFTLEFTDSYSGNPIDTSKYTYKARYVDWAAGGIQVTLSEGPIIGNQIPKYDFDRNINYFWIDYIIEGVEDYYGGSIWFDLESFYYTNIISMVYTKHKDFRFIFRFSPNPSIYYANVLINSYSKTKYFGNDENYNFPINPDASTYELYTTVDEYSDFKLIFNIPGYQDVVFTYDQLWNNYEYSKEVHTITYDLVPSQETSSFETTTLRLLRSENENCYHAAYINLDPYLNTYFPIDNNYKDIKWHSDLIFDDIYYSFGYIIDENEFYPGTFTNGSLYYSDISSGEYTIPPLSALPPQTIYVVINIHDIEPGDVPHIDYGYTYYEGSSVTIESYIGATYPLEVVCDGYENYNDNLSITEDNYIFDIYLTKEQEYEE